ncbi:hypothetical protein CHS0354_019100 [Potamilus streckersoni]|uniref:Uncharacterized protein n=1 Tax=Potamilus streckersoni TaxID=2493646 RepID=A0AAE0VHC9_9BIVA|nr:hypothetical protein CHS0354_019100 [Potamilus streckersoni]
MAGAKPSEWKLVHSGTLELEHGQYGVGKTILTKRLLGKTVRISDRKSTEGIDVHIECCKVSLATGEWIAQETDAEECSRLHRLIKILNEHLDKQEGGEMHESHCRKNDGKEHNIGHPADNSTTRKINQPGLSQTLTRKSSQLYQSQQTQPTQSPFEVVEEGHSVESKIASKFTSSESEKQSDEKGKKKDAVMEILQLVNMNSDKLENNIVEYAALSMWDFAGQYIFYTTHQTFLTSHAIYLLVIDLDQEITDLIKNDQCFLDTEGIKCCKVHELAEIWLNSIHSVALSSESGIPAVILVGIHVDRIPKTLNVDTPAANLKLKRSCPDIECGHTSSQPETKGLVQTLNVDTPAANLKLKSCLDIECGHTSSQPETKGLVQTLNVDTPAAKMKLMELSRH